METVLIAVGSAILYVVAYHTYGKWLARKIFNVDPERTVPSIARSDGKDYVPSHRDIVFGHHFTSIAGTGPIVGPAIAVIWGWLPALLWVLFGSIFIGAVHDFASLVMSLRNQGRTIGDFCGDIINKRVRILFLLIIMFTLWIVIAIFGLVIAVVFSNFPQAVLPVWLQIPIAVGLGIYLIRGGKPSLGGIVAVVLMFITVVLAGEFDWMRLMVVSESSGAAGEIVFPWTSPIVFWTILLLIYCYIASILPVQTLLQPRDYINSYQLIIAMGLLFLGVLAARPEMVAPATNFHGNNLAAAPLVIPFLFITIACGACSGFHCLVSSGVSSKQLRSESDAQYVGYGAMLLEGMLAVLVILACCAGLGMGFKGLVGQEAWLAQYSSWSGGLSAVLPALISGAGNMMTSLPLISQPVAEAIVGVFIASFAATTLDSSTRLQRYVISELADTVHVGALKNRYVATSLAVLSGLALATFDVFRAPTLGEGLRSGGMGGMTLWPLFGATNQLLAGLALLVATVWLYRKGKPMWITGLPMVFMLAMTGAGLVMQLNAFLNPASGKEPNWFLFIVGTAIFLLQVWMIVEALLFVLRLRAEKSKGLPLPELIESA